MGINLLSDTERLGRWLHKQGFPEKSVVWAISPDTGKIPHDCWQVYNGDINSIPLGKRLTFRREDGKSTIHVFIARLDSNNDKDHDRSINGSDLLPPKIAEYSRELDKRASELAVRENNLYEWENNLRLLDMELRKTTGVSIKVSMELDNRTTSIANNLKQWEQHIRDNEAASIEHIAQMNALSNDMDEVMEEKNKLAEKQAIATSVNYAFDKIMASYLLGKAKKFEDLPADTIADFQQYLIDRAERRYYKEMPDMASDLGTRFSRMPDDVKSKFCDGMIRWTIDNKPNLLKDIASEYANAKKNSNAQS